MFEVAHVEGNNCDINDALKAKHLPLLTRILHLYLCDNYVSRAGNHHRITHSDLWILYKLLHEEHISFWDVMVRNFNLVTNGPNRGFLYQSKLITIPQPYLAPSSSSSSSKKEFTLRLPLIMYPFPSMLRQMSLKVCRSHHWTVAFSIGVLFLLFLALWMTPLLTYLDMIVMTMGMHIRSRIRENIREKMRKLMKILVIMMMIVLMWLHQLLYHHKPILIPLLITLVNSIASFRCSKWTMLSMKHALAAR